MVNGLRSYRTFSLKTLCRSQNDTLMLWLSVLIVHSASGLLNFWSESNSSPCLQLCLFGVSLKSYMPSTSRGKMPGFYVSGWKSEAFSSKHKPSQVSRPHFCDVNLSEVRSSRYLLFDIFILRVSRWKRKCVTPVHVKIETLSAGVWCPWHKVVLYKQAARHQRASVSSRIWPKLSLNSVHSPFYNSGHIRPVAIFRIGPQVQTY